MTNKIKKINFEYFSMWREIPLLFFVGLFKSRGYKINNNAILIVCPCLIGEFVATVPAICDYIKRNRDKKIDLLVIPQQRDLAQKISGVCDVFVAKSAYLGRNDSGVDYKRQNFGSYKKIIYLRISEQTYALTRNIHCLEIETSFLEMFFYTIHLIKSVIIGKTPIRWSSLNFKILGGKENSFLFSELFNFSREDYSRIDSLSIFHKNKRCIIIHVGTKWVMKRWDRDRWVELIERINKTGEFDFVFVGSDDDIEDYEYISSHLSFKVGSLIKKIPLSDLPLVFKKAQYFIGIDSGPSNLAHLVGLRSITIYGPGPHIYLPINTKDIIFDKTNGRGLFQMYFEFNDSYIKKITVDEVYNAFLELNNQE